MLLTTMIKKLQCILKDHGDYPVGMRVDHDHDVLMAYLWDEDGKVTMQLDGRPHVNYELPK